MKKFSVVAAYKGNTLTEAHYGEVHANDLPSAHEQVCDIMESHGILNFSLRFESTCGQGIFIVTPKTTI